MYSASRLPLALVHGRPYHRAGSRGETIHAISGVDVALWDIYGMSLGVPIYRLLGGGVRERMPAYASGGWAPPEGDSRRGPRLSCQGLRRSQDPRGRPGRAALSATFARAFAAGARGAWPGRAAGDGRPRRPDS